jgi:hypothetical protein
LKLVFAMNFQYVLRQWLPLQRFCARFDQNTSELHDFRLSSRIWRLRHDVPFTGVPLERRIYVVIAAVVPL